MRVLFFTDNFFRVTRKICRSLRKGEKIYLSRNWIRCRLVYVINHFQESAFFFMLSWFFFFFFFFGCRRKWTIDSSHLPRLKRFPVNDKIYWYQNKKSAATEITPNFYIVAFIFFFSFFLYQFSIIDSLFFSIVRRQSSNWTEDRRGLNEIAKFSRRLISIEKSIV